MRNCEMELESSRGRLSGLLLGLLLLWLFDYTILSYPVRYPSSPPSSLPSSPPCWHLTCSHPAACSVPAGLYGTIWDPANTNFGLTAPVLVQLLIELVLLFDRVLCRPRLELVQRLAERCTTPALRSSSSQHTLDRPPPNLPLPPRKPPLSLDVIVDRTFLALVLFLLVPAFLLDFINMT